MFDPERPFHRLIQHYVTRMFYGAGDGDDLQFSIPALLGLLSVPSGFGAILLLDKYSTLRLFLMGRREMDVYAASVPDEYFFIVYSMVVTGAVIILKWDRLFPDRQDYDNLAPLPLSSMQNFSASLSALLFLTFLFAMAVNGAASAIFPYAVTSRYDTAAAYFEFAAAHAAAVLLASVFTSFSMLLLAGVVLVAAPRRYSRALSVATRLACAMALILLMSSAFTMPQLLHRGTLPGYAAYFPPFWFLDIHQTMLARGVPRTGTALLAVVAVAAAFVLAIGMYALTYYREYMRIPERGGFVVGRGSDSYSVLRRLADAVALRTSSQQAIFHFSVKTLFRSDRHCFLFGAGVALGLFFAAQSAGKAIGFDNLGAPVVSEERVIAVPLILIYFTMVTLRALFDLPGDPRANWVFRFMLDRKDDEGRNVAVRVLGLLVTPWLLLAFLVYASFWGWGAAALLAGHAAMVAILLAEFLLLNFRKIPFTCTYTASKDRILLMAVLGIIGLSVFTELNARFAASLLRYPARLPFSIAVFAVALWWIRYYRSNRSYLDRSLIFDDRPAPAVQRLDLSK